LSEIGEIYKKRTYCQELNYIEGFGGKLKINKGDTGLLESL